jgi:hypothetical protein
VLNCAFTDFTKSAIEITSNAVGSNVIEGNTFTNIGNAINASDAPFTVIRYNRVETSSSAMVNSKVTINMRASPVDIGFNTLVGAKDGQVNVDFGVLSGVVSPGSTWYIHHNFMYSTHAQRTVGNNNGDNGIQNEQDTQAGSISYIFNNTIVGVKNCGVQMNGPSTNKYYLKNNLLAHNSRRLEKVFNDYDIRERGDPTSLPQVTIDHSLSYMDPWITTQTVILTTPPYNQPTMANIVGRNPLVVDTTADNYAITASSPARDAGEAFPWRFLFNYYGSAPDIGAFEYGTPSITNVIEIEPGGMVASNYELSQNYPNPFNPVTTIRFSIPKSGLVTLTVYNVLGQAIATLVNEWKEAGTHSTTFDIRHSKFDIFPSGVYFYRLHADNFVQVQKMLLLR